MDYYHTTITICLTMAARNYAEDEDAHCADVKKKAIDAAHAAVDRAFELGLTTINAEVRSCTTYSALEDQSQMT